MSSGDDAVRRQHEVGLALFVQRPWRTRLKESLQEARQRETIHEELYRLDGRRLDPRWATLHEMHTKHDEHAIQVHESLVEAGAPPTCFVVSDDELDGLEVPLGKAVEELMSTGEGFLSCLPGRLGLYVGEDGSEVYVLRRDVSN